MAVERERIVFAGGGILTVASTILDAAVSFAEVSFAEVLVEEAFLFIAVFHLEDGQDAGSKQ